MNAHVTKTESVTNRTMLAYDKLNKIADRWLTRDEKQLVDRATAQSSKNADAGILYLLYTDYNFTPEQLIELIGKFREQYSYIENDSEASIKDIPAVEELKNIGVDLDEIYEGNEQ